MPADPAIMNCSTNVRSPLMCSTRLSADACKRHIHSPRLPTLIEARGMHKDEAAWTAVSQIWNSGQLASLRSLLRLDREQTGAVLSVFIGAGLIIAPVPAWALLYYIFVLPFCVIILLRNHVLLTREPGTILSTALIVWFTSGVIWDRS